MIQVTGKGKGKRKRRRKASVCTFKPTVSSFFYDQPSRQLVEYEFYMKIARRARTRADIKSIRAILEEKARRHFRSWLLRHLNVRLDRPVHVSFEREQREKRQVEQAYASVQRLVLRRVDKRWEAQDLPSGRMRFAKRRKLGRA